MVSGLTGGKRMLMTLHLSEMNVKTSRHVSLTETLTLKEIAARAQRVQRVCAYLNRNSARSISGIVI